MAIAIGADEKKKLYVLGGFLAAVVVVGTVVFILPGKGTDTEENSVKTASPKTDAPKAPATPAGGGAASPAPAGGVNAASLVAVTAFRPDPFAQFEKPALPPELRPPGSRSPGSRSPESRSRTRGRDFTPTFVDNGPVEILPPEQVNILPPGQSGSDQGGLPPMDVGNKREPILSRTAEIKYPKIDIPREVSTPVIPKSAGDQGSGGIATSSDKRLSGVIIGDSVRAMIEMGDGTTRIVQPGDEVDGITVLRIERVTEGGRPVTRVIIREGGQERAVVLKSATRTRPAARP